MPCSYLRCTVDIYGPKHSYVTLNREAFYSLPGPHVCINMVYTTCTPYHMHRLSLSIWSTQQRVNDVDRSGSSKSHQPSKSLTSRCVRSSRGQDANQVCEPCLANQVQCVTKKRRVGRQPGVKNRQRAGEASSGYSEVIATSDIDHLPNPLHVLASVAAGGHPALP